MKEIEHPPLLLCIHYICTFMDLGYVIRLIHSNFLEIKKSYDSVWNWIQRFGSLHIYKKKSFSIPHTDETIIQIGSSHIWLWICIEPNHRFVLEINISKKRNTFVAENFIRSLVEKYGKHIVYTDSGTWYPQACNFLHLKHHLHSPLEKSLIERVMQYFKDRTEF